MMQSITSNIHTLLKDLTTTLLPLSAIAALFMVMSCSRPSIPTDAIKANKPAQTFPDYAGVTIPSNLCPTNFMLPYCDEAVARFSVGNLSFTYGEDNKVIIDQDEWKQLTTAAAGNSKGITVEVYGKSDDKWLSYDAFTIYVATDTIDPYIAYRLIQPSYVNYDALSIVQRDITSYDESDIYTNQLIQTEQNGQCINCHSFQNYNTGNMLFHMREYCGGTMILHNGQLKKVDLKTDGTISAGVYPAWHPTADLVAFSTNTTRQIFHTNDNAKVEVFDKASDLILYNVAKNEVSMICSDTTLLENFPTWSPDGKTLYYTCAQALPADSAGNTAKAREHYQEIKYNIYSRSFDIATHRFGEPNLVFDAVSLGKSATLPRVSPDGRYLTFSLGCYGCFHVWHSDADICVIDLTKQGDGQQPTMLDTKAINSPQSESYPSFSSNGRWIMTASRRDDGNYTRPYIAYFDKQGKCHKAFQVPQRDPQLNTALLYSYNRPEFLRQKVNITPQQFADQALKDAEPATLIIH